MSTVIESLEALRALGMKGSPFVYSHVHEGFGDETDEMRAVGRKRIDLKTKRLYLVRSLFY